MPYFTHGILGIDWIDELLQESLPGNISVLEFILKGVPHVFVPKTPLLDSRFFDPLNTWYINDNKPLKESLESLQGFLFPQVSKRASQDTCWLLWMLHEATPVVFDSYEKEDGTRKSEYGRYARIKSDDSAKNQDNEAFEHVIRYEDGIKSDFVLASSSVPVNYDYTRLNVETSALSVEGQGDDTAMEDSNRPASYSNSNRRCCNYICSCSRSSRSGIISIDYSDIGICKFISKISHMTEYFS